MSEPRFSLGPLEALLQDQDVTAVMADEHQIRYRKDNVTHVSAHTFSSRDALLEVIRNVAQAGGVAISPEQAAVDCVLADGTRVIASLNPAKLELHKA